MRSPSTSNRSSAGFTLLEVLIVIAIFVCIAALGLIMSMDAYRQYSFHSEVGTVVSVLQKARSRAMSNVDQTPWGACYDSTGPDYIIFRGTSYSAGASTNEPVPASASATVTGSPFACAAGGIVFSQLGGTTTATKIVVTQDARVNTTTINNEGTIIW